MCIYIYSKYCHESCPCTSICSPPDVVLSLHWLSHHTRACEQSRAGSGACEIQSERVFNQRPERSLCLGPVPLRYRSHHEPRACTNPPRMLRVDFPFCTYVICLTLPVAYARIRCSPTTPQPRPRDRIEVKRIFSAAVTQQTHSTSATQAVCPRRKASVENGRC